MVGVYLYDVVFFGGDVVVLNCSDVKEEKFYVGDMGMLEWKNFLKFLVKEIIVVKFSEDIFKFFGLVGS